MDDITIVTVNWYSADYLQRLVANLHDKAARPEDLQLLIIDNTNGKDPNIESLHDAPVPYRLERFNCGKYRGSLAHALALDHATRMLETEYALIIDPDVYVFRWGWDTLCVDELKSQKAVAIGVPFPPWKVGKYHDFPSPPFCFFRTRTLRFLENGWTPYSSTFLHEMWVFCLRQVGRMGQLLTRRRYEKYPLLRKYAELMEHWFGVFSQDTGWRIAQEAHTTGLKSIVFETVLPDDIRMAPQGAKEAFAVLAKEYEFFSYRNEPMLAHKYGSGGFPWRTRHGADEQYWCECIERAETTYGFRQAK